MSQNFHSGGQDEAKLAQPLYVPIKRRSFFMYAGATAGATALVLAGCKDDDDDTPPATTTIDVGTGDTGILNYAYALEQLEAAFYAQVLAGSYFTGLAATSAERQVLIDIALHERIHADFFKTKLGTAAIKNLEPNFSSINFNDRNSVLTNAKTFEDLGVAAYNGAGRYITSLDNLIVAGKIVSVEARHAALIRDMLAPNTFVGSDVIDIFTPTGAAVPPGNGSGSGLERSKKPQEVLSAANNFLAAGSKLTANSFV